MSQPKFLGVGELRMTSEKTTFPAKLFEVIAYVVLFLILRPMLTMLFFCIFFIANNRYFLSEFFLGPYSERNFI